jgi:hypothetical protein
MAAEKKYKKYMIERDMMDLPKGDIGMIAAVRVLARMFMEG